MIRALLLALGVALAPGAARAQAGDPPDVPRGDGRLRGRVLLGHGESPAGGVDVLLYALPAQAPPGLRRTTSAADGSFVFEGIDRDPATTYLVGARYAGVSYPGARVQFGAGEREREADVRVYEVTEDAGAAALRELRIRLDWLGDRVEVSEEIDVANPGQKTLFVAAGRRGAHPPVVVLGLPEGARDLTGPLGLVPDGLERSGSALRWYGPVLPGGSELAYGYGVPAPVGTLALERALTDAPLRVTVQVPTGGLALEAPGLSEGQPTVVAGRGYRVFSGERSGQLRLELAVPAARTDPGAVSLAEVRIIGELDAAAFVAREEHVIQVAGEAPVVAAPGAAPLLALPLPEGASDLRFGAPQSGTRLATLPDGSGIGVLGPLAPGETVLEVHYRLPAGAGPFTLARRFAAPIPLLSVYVADPGNLRVASARLHRRRPARTPDRTYLHLEAFELAPGEEAALTLRTLPPRRELPRAAAVGFVALATALAALALAGPLRGAPRPSAEGGESESPAEREREALLAALGDLEHDFETGKLDPADYAGMRADLESRSAVLKPPAPAPGEIGPLLCPGCGHAPGAGDRFCARCGTKLGEAL